MERIKLISVPKSTSLGSEFLAFMTRSCCRENSMTEDDDDDVPLTVSLSQSRVRILWRSSTLQTLPRRS